MLRINGEFKWVWFVLFVCFSVLLAWNLGRTLQAVFLFERTQGIVTEQTYGDNVDGFSYLRKSKTNLYEHTASFQAQDGKMYYAKTKVRSNPSPFRVGDRVTVYFNKKNPGDARFATFGDLWMGPLSLGFFWLIFFLLWFGTWIGKPSK
jgi:hypothetical protein